MQDLGSDDARPGRAARGPENDPQQQSPRWPRRLDNEPPYKGDSLAPTNYFGGPDIFFAVTV